jgi:hypothetical protein
MIAVEVQVIEYSRRLCGEKFADLKRHVDYAALLWRDRNSTELDALIAQDMEDSTLAKTTASTALLALQELDVGKQNAYCQGFAVSLPQGQRDVAERMPRASRYLTAYLEEHPLSAEQTRGANFEMGCLKASFNKGTDLDDAQRTCSCNWDAMSSSFSASEWREYEATAAARGNIAELPHVQRIVPQLARCAESTASN